MDQSFKRGGNAMKFFKTFLVTLIFLSATISIAAFARDYAHSTPGLSGYDPVAYFTDGKPMKGTGFHEIAFRGVTYVFASEDHKKQFMANPERYLPAYGGYCAYGVAVGKKFVADPEVWKIVDGKLYLNLDRDIQRRWEKDIPGYLKKADANWSGIKDQAPSDL
jgi:YHS domain-containing protein